MKILIIEDEPTTAKRLVKMIGEVDPTTEVLEVIDTVEESIYYFASHVHPELVFMDIHLADGNSFEIFEKTNVESAIIFTTAYDQYAIKAFKVNSIDYLLKPVKREELSAALMKFRHRSQKEKESIPDFANLASLINQATPTYLKRFMVKAGQQIRTVNVSDVAYFWVENKIVTAMDNAGQRHITDFTMELLEKSLDPEQFFRINRSFIISIDSIDSMTAYSKSRIKIELNPSGGPEAITSSERSASFKKWLSGQ